MPSVVSIPAARSPVRILQLSVFLFWRACGDADPFPPRLRLSLRSAPEINLARAAVSGGKRDTDTRTLRLQL